MTRPLSEYYNINRESLPPEFTASGVKVVVSLTGTQHGYRSRTQGQGMLDPDDFPVRRVITLFDADGNQISSWTENLELDRKFNSKSTWVDLGVGVRPDNSRIKKFLYHTALGYLSGYPIKDVLSFGLNFDLLPQRGKRILEQEATKRELGAEPLSYTDRVRMVNPHYDERDT